MNFTTASLTRTYSKLTNSLICCLAIVFLASCNKPEDGYLKSNSGSHLLNLQQTDTFSLNMTSEFIGFSPQSSQLSSNIIGTFIDPIFGRTTSSIYTQVAIGPSPTPTWTSASSMDSIVVAMKMYNTALGIGNKTFAGQKWHLYQLGVSIPEGLVYPSDTVLALNPVEIGSGPVRFNAKDSTLRLTLKASAISTQFRNYVFDSVGNPSLFTDATYFDQFMHGMYIMPDSVLSSGNGALNPVNLADTSSGITIYYDASKAWRMIMSSPSERIDKYTHNFTNTEAWKHVGAQGKGSDRVYIQALGGIRCVVTVPYLANLVKNSMVVVNQAEFIFPKVDSSADPYNSNNPTIMLFRPRMYDGRDSLYDFTDDNSAVDYYGGRYQAGSKSYKFIMSRYIQRLLNVYRNKPGSKNYGINLHIPPDGPNSPARTLLYTQLAGNKQNRPKLVITYTKIEDRK